MTLFGSVWWVRNQTIYIKDFSGGFVNHFLDQIFMLRNRKPTILGLEVGKKFR
jgi:hypothetical protein